MAFASLSESQLRDVFDAFDQDGSGFVDKRELLTILIKLAEAGAIDADSDECKASTKDIIDKSDKAGTADGRMSFDEFKQVLGN